MNPSPVFKNIAEEHAHRIWDKKDFNALNDLLHPKIITPSLLEDYVGITYEASHRSLG